ncbi:MAG: hypothetical protein WAQ17_02075 [Limnochordia bacterium]
MADSKLRTELEEKYGEVWVRTVRRRKTMAMFGCELHEDVLPMNDIQGQVQPSCLLRLRYRN